MILKLAVSASLALFALPASLMGAEKTSALGQLKTVEKNSKEAAKDANKGKLGEAKAKAEFTGGKSTKKKN